MTSPDRLLARLLAGALALIGSLTIVLLALVDVSRAPARAGGRAIWCLIAPVSSIDGLIHLSTLAVWLLGAGVALSAIRSISRDRATGAELRLMARAARLRAWPPQMRVVAHHLGVADWVDVVHSPAPFGFAYGWLRPRICVSTGLIARLDPLELEAVLHHERWHLLRRDPLRLLIVRAISAATFMFPPLRRAAGHCRVAIELAADNHAVAMMGDCRWLASALEKLLDERQPAMDAAFAGEIDARIAALTGDPLTAGDVKGQAVLVALGVELLAAILLLTRGNAPLLAAIWLHPRC